MIILPTAYFGNIQYFSKFLSPSGVVIDVFEHYRKQTYRNRCDIMGVHGVLSLTVPVVKVHYEKVPVKELRIDYSTKWQPQHKTSIVSGYANAPYFDHYHEPIFRILDKKERFLIDLNNTITETLLQITGISDTKLPLSDRYMEKTEGIDGRELITPKKHRQADEHFDPNNEYYQVFSDRLPFAPNLSLLDLLFCEGPSVKSYLEQSAHGIY